VVFLPRPMPNEEHPGERGVQNTSSQSPTWGMSIVRDPVARLLLGVGGMTPASMSPKY
jgi:hypothetical protein